MSNLYFKIPKLNEMHYRKKWMMDPKTMDYNKGYDLDLNGYNKLDGTIKRSDKELEEWFYKWVNNKPEKYFAYVYVDKIDEPIGEAYYYLDGDKYSMGLLIQDKYRGNGYSYKALLELERIAFEENNIPELMDKIPPERKVAIYNFKKAGFKYLDDSIDELIITKEMYFKKK